MGRKRKDREEIEEDKEYTTDMEEYVQEIEVKKKRVPKEGYVQYRCSMVAFLKAITENKTKLSSDNRMELLQATPFGKMIAAFQNNMIEENYVKKSDDALTMLLQAYDAETESFAFGGKKFRISTKDICEIFGLPEEGVMVPLPANGAYHSVFVDKYFVNLKRISKRCVEKALNDALTKVCRRKVTIKENDKDVVRLILLLLCITVLFPNAGATISWDLVKHCEDLEQIGTYGWAKAVGNFLHKSIKAFKKGTKNDEGSRAMGGCAVLILFWFCEKTKLIPPIHGRENEELGMSKWCLKTMNQKLKEFKNLEEMKELFKMVQEDKDDDLDSEEKYDNTEIMGEDNYSNSSTSSKIDESPEDESLDIWLSEVSTQTEKRETKKKGKNNFKKVVAELLRVIKEEMKERPNLVAVGELIDNICKHKRIWEKKNRKYWNLILKARKQFEAIKEREIQLTDEKNNMKEENMKLEMELKRKEEEVRELKRDRDVLMAEKAAEDHEVASSIVELAGINSPTIPSPNQMASPIVELAGINTPIVPASKDRRTFELAASEDNKIASSTVEPVAQDVGSPRVLSIQIHPTSPEILVNNTSVTTRNNIFLYSYVVRLKKRLRIKKNDEIYWFEQQKKRKRTTKKTNVPASEYDGSILCATPNLVSLDPETMCQIHILSDHDDKDEQQVELLKSIDWSSQQVFKLMDILAQNQLQDYWDNTSLEEFFWETEIHDTKVLREDVRELICDGAIANNVIDSFAKLLNEELLQEDSQELGRSAFLNSFGLNTTKALAIKNIHVSLYEPLFWKLGKCNKLFIPIIHEEKYHHTLLMLDKDVPQWIHFDSNRGRTRYKAGKCFNNAKVMVKMVQIWMTAIKDQADDLLEQGCRMKVDVHKSTSEELTMTEVPLGEDEIETIKWIKNTNCAEILLKESLDCPQEDSNSLDCGVFVMYYMDILSNEKILPNEISKEKVREYRAYTFKSFAEHKQSWNSKNKAT